LIAEILVCYGDYHPVTAVGRIIAVTVMFSGIGIFLLLVGTRSQRRLQQAKLRLKSETEVQARLLDDETKRAIKNKIDGIEKMTEEDFDTLIIMIKRVLEESRNICLYSKCVSTHHRKAKFCSKKASQKRCYFSSGILLNPYFTSWVWTCSAASRFSMLAGNSSFFFEMFRSRIFKKQERNAMQYIYRYMLVFLRTLILRTIALDCSYCGSNSTVDMLTDYF
jgi:ion channel